MSKVGRLLDLSPERYVAGFRAFLATYETETDDNYKSFGGMFPDSVLCEPGADLCVLGIGSGSGETDSDILKKLLQRHDSVYNRVVEPSEEMIGRYKALVREDTSLSAVKCDWRQQTAEEYFQKFQTKADTKFHLKDLYATLRNMWEQLADGGYMLVGMESDKSDWGKMEYKLRELFGQHDSPTTSFGTPADIKHWLDEMDISYVTSEDEIKMNVAECFKEDSEAGMLLLDFLTQTPDVSAEPGMRAAALEYIQQNSSVVDDKILFNSVTEVIVASKTCAK
ncbi:hypothetical protein Bbelb_379090 [Branchiostoma belcheri]|nr:hypothetical protein Bbelb_379090 [Branchiostoma belcheri]